MDNLTNTSFDTVQFGQKLRNHRKTLSLTQEDVALKIGVSGQAISKWENAECLPDCYNLSSIAKAYGISLDILLDTSISESAENSISKIKQIAHELMWRGVPADYENAHNDIGDDLWEIWRALYFLEIGDKDIQQNEFKRGAYKVASSFGAKFWDNDGIACIVKSSLKEKYNAITDESVETVRMITTDNYLNILKLIDLVRPISRETIAEKTRLDIAEVTNVLVELTEKGIVEYMSVETSHKGYKLTVKKGTVVSMMLAAMYLISSEKYSTSEYSHHE